MRKNKAIAYIAFYAIYTALIAILTFVPYIGFISIGPVSLTTIHVAVLVFSYLAGWKHSAFFGLIFGLSSLLVSATHPSGILDPFFVNPLISVLPRVLFSFIAGVLMSLAKKIHNKALHGVTIAVISLVTTFLHSVMVLGMCGLLYFDVLNAKLADAGAGGYWIAFGVTLLTNTLPEMALAFVLVYPIGLALKRPFNYTMGKTSNKQNVEVVQIENEETKE